MHSAKWESSKVADASTTATPPPPPKLDDRWIVEANIVRVAPL